MTKLEALNIVLQGVGVLPVTSYESSHPDAVGGRTTLERFNQEIQERGWWFNRDYNLKLNPETDGTILLPQNTLRVEAVGPSDGTDPDLRYELVQRGNKLYNMQDNTYDIGIQVDVDIVSLLPFDDCPTPAQTYIARSAAYEYSFSNEGDQAKVERLRDLMMQAKSKAMSSELKNSNFNAFRAPRVARSLGGIIPARGRR